MQTSARMHSRSNSVGQTMMLLSEYRRHRPMLRAPKVKGTLTQSMSGTLSPTTTSSGYSTGCSSVSTGKSSTAVEHKRTTTKGNSWNVFDETKILTAAIVRALEEVDLSHCLSFFFLSPDKTNAMQLRYLFTCTFSSNEEASKDILAEYMRACCFVHLTSFFASNTEIEFIGLPTVSSLRH